MAEDNKDIIYLNLGDLKNLPLTVSSPYEHKVCRRAEEIVNKFWGAWKTRYDKLTSEELMSRIAFQMARMYVEANWQNAEVNEVLVAFERNLNELLVKVKRDEE